MRFWFAALAVAAVKEETVVPICAVIPFGVIDIPRLPIALASLANQDVKPLEVQLVANIPLSSDYNGFFMAPNARTLEFKNMTGIPNLPTDQVYSKSIYQTEQAALNHIFKVLDHLIVDNFVDIPNLQLWVRTSEQSDASNRSFGASKCADAAEVISFFTGSDIMHPNRIRRIWEEMSKNVHADIPTVLLHNARRFNPLVEDSTFERQEDIFGAFERSKQVAAVASSISAEDITSKIKGAYSCSDLVQFLNKPVASQWMSVTTSLLKERLMADGENTDHFICNLFNSKYYKLFDKEKSEEAMGNAQVLYLPKALGLYLESPSNLWGDHNLKTEHLKQTACSFSEGF